MTDWQEKYMRLRDEHSDLKLAFNSKVEEVKRTNVQLTKIENLLKMKDKMDSASGGGYATAVARAEQEKIIKKLYDEKAALQAKNGDMEKRVGKLREAVERYKKKEKLAARTQRNTRPMSAPAHDNHVNLSRKGSSDAQKSSPAKGGDNDNLQGVNAAKLQELTNRFRQRLESAEAQLAHVREENNALRKQAAAAGFAGDRETVAMHAATPAPELAAGAGFRNLDEESSRLHRELSDTKAKLQLLQTRYDHLEAKAKAQVELQQGSYDQLEDYNRRIRELRRAVQDLQLDKTSAEARAMKAEELELEVAELRDQNDKYENQIKKLCESPFIKQAFDKEEKMQKLEEMSRNEKGQQLKIEHLQETARNHHAALVAMKKQCQQLKADKESAVNELEELKARYTDTTQATQLLKDKMKLYAGDDGVDMDDLEQALTIVKRKVEGVPALDHLNLEKVDGEVTMAGAGPEALPILRAKVRELYEANQMLQYEVERAESMLKAQLAINRELHLELEAVEKSKGADRKEIEEKVLTLQGDCARQQNRIKVLEAERKQRLYDVRRGKKGRGARGSLGALLEEGDDSTVAESEGGDTLLDELGDGEELGPDENLVEVWVREASMSDDAWDRDSPTFAIVDFFNFESEATPVLEGRNPQFDFASSYRVVVDDFLLKFLATESLVVELCKVQGADFELLGRCQVPLYRLLQSRPSLKLASEPLMSARDGSQIGSLNLEVRMGKPVDQLFALFLDQHPEEKLRIDHALARLLGTGANAGAGANALPVAGSLNAASAGALADPRGELASRLQNELEVIVHSAKALPVREGTTDLPPSAFVHYQLMHFPDTFTRVVPESFEPLFEHMERFPMPTNAQMLGLLASGQSNAIEFSVLDDIDDDEADGIGAAKLSLAPLADGDPVYARLPVVNDVERTVGHLSVVVRWRHAFRMEKEPGPNGLTGRDVAELLSRFSPSKDGQVDWAMFLAWGHPPIKVAHAVAMIREYADDRRVADALEVKDIFDHLSDPFSKAQLRDDERTWRQLRDVVTPDELEALFDHLDLEKADYVSLPMFLHFLHPPSYAVLALEARVRTRLHQLHLQGIQIARFFQEVDAAQSGRLSRGEFKRVLRERLGFELLDEPTELTVPVPLDDVSRLNANAMAPAMSPPTADDELLRQRGTEYFAMTEARDRFEQQRAELERLAGSANDLVLRDSSGGGGGSGSGGVAASLERQKQMVAGGATTANFAEQLGGAAGGGGGMDVTNQVGPATISSNRYPPGVAHDVDALLDELRRELQAANGDNGLSRPLDLVRIFEIAADPQRCGFVDHQGFALALEKAGLSAATVGEALVQRFEDVALAFDPRQDGHVNYKAFANSVLGEGAFGDDGAPVPLQQLTIDGNGGDAADGMVDYGVVGMPSGALASAASNDAISVSVAAAEDALFEAVRRVEGQRARPNLVPDFETFAADEEGGMRDWVLAKQFLHVVNQHFSGDLHTPDLRNQLLKFFRVASSDPSAPRINQSGGGEKCINYRQFAVFMDYRKPEASPAVRAIESMTLHSGSKEAFYKFDTRGQGIVTADEFKLAMEALGQDSIHGRKLNLEQVARLFAPVGVSHSAAGAGAGAGVVGGAGCVDWSAFLDFALENGDSKSLAAVENAVRAQLQRERARFAGIKDVKSVLAARDRQGRGWIEAADFESALAELGVALDEPQLDVLYRRIGEGGEVGGGVRYGEFAAFIERAPEHNPSNVLLTDRDRKRLQARAFRVIEEVFGRLGEEVAGKTVLSQFEHYDFRGLGVVGIPEFCKAALRAGFTYTRAELRALAEDFLAQTNTDNALAAPVVEYAVHYRRFVSWATPTIEALSHNAAAHASSSNEPGGAHPGLDAEREDAVMNLLKKKLAAQARLVGGRVETWPPFEAMLDASSGATSSRRGGGGFVSRDAFLRALDRCELGLTERESMLLAERFDLQRDGSVSFREFARFIEAGNPELSVHASIAGGLGYGHGGGGGGGVAAPTSLRRLQEVTKRCVAKGVDYRKAFDTVDEAGGGVISRAQLRHVLDELNANLSEADVSELEGRFQGSGASDVAYLEMLHSAQPGSQGTGELWRHEEKLRHLIRKRFQWWIPGKLRKCFKHFDQRRSGKISEADLSSGLKMLKFRLSAEQEHALFAFMDLDGDGTVTYADLVVFVRDPNHRHVAHRLRSELNKRSVQASNLRRMLEDCDGNGSGLLGATDFGRVLRKAGCELSEDEVRRLMLRFDVNEDGNVSIERAMNFVVGEREVGGGVGLGADKAAVKKIMRRLREKAQAAKEKHGTKAREVFEFFDADLSGEIDAREFADGLMRLHLNCDRSEIQALMLAFGGSGGDGKKVSYRNFLKTLELGSDGELLEESAAAKKDVMEIVGREARRVTRSDRHSRPRYLRTFQDADRDDRGYLPKRDFQRCLDSFGFELTGPEIRRIVEYFDSDRSDGQRVNYRDFVALAEEVEQNDKDSGPVAGALKREMKRLGKSASDVRRKFESAFEAMDRRDEGVVSTREFRRGVEELRLDLDDREMRQVCDALDKRGDGEEINFRRFVRMCEDAARAAEEDLDRGTGGGGDRSALLHEFGAEMKRMDRSRLPRPNFRRILDKADVDGSGELDRRTLTDAVKDSGVDLSRKVIKQIFELLDVDYAGRVRISDFLRFVDDSIGEDLRAEDEHIDEEMRELRQQVQRAVDAGIDIIECFEHFDTDTSGTIDEDEFYRGLQKLDMDVSRSEARKMMDKFPGRRRGQIKFREFIKAMRLKRSDVDMEDVAEKIRREIRRLAETRYGRPRFRQVFEEIDRDGSGSIDRREFKKALEQMGFELSSRDMKKLIQKFDSNYDGMITYKEFRRFAEDGDGDVRSSRDRDNRSSSRYDEDIDEDMRRLKRIVQKAVDSGVDVVECFEHFDTDFSGAIDEDEFYRGLQKLDMDVSRSEARKMMDKFPGRRRGQIKFREFIKAMRLERREEVDTRGLQEDIRREIRRLAETRYGRPRFRQVFEEIDRDGSGTIDRREFKKAMEQIGFELSSRQVKQLFTKFDRYFTGEITYKDFEKFAEDGDGDVRSSRDRDYRSSSRYDDRYSGSRSPSRRSPRSRGVRYSDSSYN